MNDFTFLKYASKNTRTASVPSKRTIQTILDYSKAVQVKKLRNCKVYFFMNN